MRLDCECHHQHIIQQGTVAAAAAVAVEAVTEKKVVVTWVSCHAVGLLAIANTMGSCDCHWDQQRDRQRPRPRRHPAHYHRSSPAWPKAPLPAATTIASASHWKYCLAHRRQMASPTAALETAGSSAHSSQARRAQQRAPGNRAQSDHPYQTAAVARAMKCCEGKAGSVTVAAFAGVVA